MCSRLVEYVERGEITSEHSKEKIMRDDMFCPGCGFVCSECKCSSGSSACSGADARRADKANPTQLPIGTLLQMLPDGRIVPIEAAVSPRSSDGTVPTPVISKSVCTVRLHFDSIFEADEAFDKLVEWYGQANNTDE